MMLSAIALSRGGRPNRLVSAFSTSLVLPGRPQAPVGAISSLSSLGAELSSSSALFSSSSGLVGPEAPPPLILPSHPDTPIRSVMAPMVAASDYPFRQLLRQHCGVDLTYTQMIHSKNFVTDPTFRRTHLDLYEAGATYGIDRPLLPCQLDCLGDLPTPSGPTPTEADGPCMVQLAGNDPEVVVQAALQILEHTQGRVTGFDLNCGCPQGIARKGNYGAFLMERDDRHVCTILSALRDALPSHTAVSAKIRLPLDDAILHDRIPRLIDTGISFLTIHGRTLHENKTKVGAVHTTRLRQAIETAHTIDPHFPIVVNGGMETYRDVQAMLTATGAVAGMSSEALLEMPTVFQERSLDLTPGQRLDQQFGIAREYLDICATVVPPLPGVLGVTANKGGSFSVIRAHLFKMLHRYIGEHSDLRDVLIADQTRTITQARDFLDVLQGRYTRLSQEELNAQRSSSHEASWYRRHRKGQRRVHQKEIRVAAFVTPTKTVEERKQEVKDRIQRLKQQNEARVESPVKRFI